MIVRKKYSVLFVIFLLVFFQPGVFSQSKSEKEIPSHCEYVRAILDDSLVRASEIEDAHVIFIFRLGKNEKSRKLINQRMELVRNHIKFRKQDPDRFILAEGEKTNGLGKLEIYIAGKLAGVIFAKKNANFGYDCLEEPF